MNGQFFFLGMAVANILLIGAIYYHYGNLSCLNNPTMSKDSNREVEEINKWSG